MARASTALVTKLQDQVKTLKAKNKTQTLEVQQSKIPHAVGLSGAFLAGSFTAGVTDAVIGEEIAGMPSDLAVGLLAIGIGIGLKSPYVVALGTGMAADRAREYGFETARGFMGGRLQATELKEVSGGK